jgi:hypothetical protein
MRVINFFLLVLFGLVSVGAGFATDPPPAKSAIPSTGFTGLRFPPSESMAIERFRMPVSSDALPGDSIVVGPYYLPGNRMDSSPAGTVWLSPRPGPAPGICYRMRTYRMERVSPHSDVTEPAGYAECEPGLKYSVKDAVGVGETPPPR